MSADHEAGAPVPPAPKASSRRIKPLLILAVIAASGLALLAWTQTWATLQVTLDGASAQALEVTGSIAAPGLTALALAGLALAGALTIAGPVIRIILGLLEILLGVSVILSAGLAIGDPVGAGSAAVTAATGIAGSESTRAGVSQAQLTGWPYLALAAGVFMLIIGLAVCVTARRWPGPTKRYETTRFAPADGAGEPTPGTAAETPGGQTRPRDAVDDWDGLTRGDDPTAPER
ncbi:Trp biosynthesis-associated membrane protein [Cryobacterium sp. PAMC25264]|uniref:Trp biosynthesis-associated membrane protein n=1 Tax=Cryobacterium sp. PAMC25264 TaxID=2861288 RepID=UPI001C636141|nr:Trp biosynthesis-associated membrane protein [Cryobacterium sp. PAMC25264]QYF74946.1 Trp biosynthesis-associated membrane protein [Cryobacterium sp. PAMC25264]